MSSFALIVLAFLMVLAVLVLVVTSGRRKAGGAGRPRHRRIESHELPLRKAGVKPALRSAPPEAPNATAVPKGGDGARSRDTDVERLISALKEGDDKSVNELVKIGAPAIEPLIAALKDTDTSRDASTALADIGTPAVEPLIAALKGPLGWTATDVLVKIGASGFSEKAENTLVKLGIPAFEALNAAVKDSNTDVSKGAARVLKHIGDDQAQMRALMPLIAALRNSNWKGRQVADVTQDAVRQLVQFYQITPRSEGFSCDTPGRAAVRELGNRLDEIGGMDLMLEVHKRFSSQVPQGARNLEMAWNTVGSWLG